MTGLMRPTYTHSQSNRIIIVNDSSVHIIPKKKKVCLREYRNLYSKKCLYMIYGCKITGTADDIRRKYLSLGLVRFVFVFERNLFCSPRLHLLDQK